MASRHLRRLQGPGLGLGDPASEDDESETDESDDGGGGFATTTSAFALLQEEGSDDGSGSEQEPSDVEEDVPAPREDAVAQEASGKKKKAKRKKKKKKKKNNKNLGDSEAGKEADLDALLEEFGGLQGGRDPGEVDTSSAMDDAPDMNALLAVEANYLSPERELRRLFGSGVVASSTRERPHGRHGRHGRQHRLRRKNVLFQAPDNWQKPDIGLTMEHVRSVDGVAYFQYKWSRDYLALQEQYEALAATHDPNALVDLLRRHPYHLDTLLNLFYIYTHTSNFTAADSFLQRMLFVLESAFHPWFDVTSGTCRLEYSLEENKTIFQVLFRYIASLSRRGCHRCALEVSKLLLSLDRTDPMGILFCIDYHAIRAREYQFVLDIVSTYEEASHLPNFCYNVALAKWYLEREGEDDGGEEGSSSSELLSQAVTTFPVALRKLLDKLQTKSMVTMAQWSGVLEPPLVGKASCDGSSSLEHLVSLFVERNYELYKDSEVQAWALESAKRALAMEDDPEGAAADWKMLKREIFPPSEVNLYRHINLADFSDHMNQIPEDVLLQMGQQPRPPQGVGAPGGQGLGQTVHIGGEQLRESNAVAMLLQSLLPWVSVEAGGAPQQNPNPEEGDNQDPN